MQLIKLELNHEYLYCPVTGQLIQDPEMGYGDIVESVRGYWIGEIADQPEIKDEKLGKAWEVFCEANEDASWKVTRFLEEYDASNWVVFELTSYGMACGPVSSTIWYVIDMDRVLEEEELEVNQSVIKVAKDSTMDDVLKGTDLEEEYKEQIQSRWRKLEDIHTQQERIDAIAEDIDSGDEIYKVLAEKDISRFISLLTDRNFSDIEPRQWVYPYNWIDIIDEPGADEESIISLLKLKVPQERMDHLMMKALKNRGLKSSALDLLTEEERNLCAKAYTKLIMDNAPDSCDFKSKVLVLRSSNAKKLYFENWYEEDLYTHTKGPYEIGENSLGDGALEVY